MIIPDDKRILFPMPALGPDNWRSDAPPHLAHVMGCSTDDRGRQYAIPFAVTFRGGSWRNAATGEVMAVTIDGWRGIWRT